ncbi:MAG: hypothetical protein J6R59_15900 [Paludibacteraceae bacterium]|jgi:hypothetical protein|nr:hypothetical protein [Paludibacteraceae bacterium]
MSEMELLLVNEGENCTLYTIQFMSEDKSEFERFYAKFKNDVEYDNDLMRIVALIDKIADKGALERLFRPEGKYSDGVCALPVIQSKLRLYCLRLSDKILILGNGGAKTTRTYNEDDVLKGYVITLQNFEKLLKDGEKDGSVVITENTIETDKIFNI